MEAVVAVARVAGFCVSGSEDGQEGVFGFGLRREGDHGGCAAADGAAGARLVGVGCAAFAEEGGLGEVDVGVYAAGLRGGA